MSEHLQAAKIILEQLGGSAFVAMTGASNMTASNEQRGALSFRLPGTHSFVKDGINHVKVTLTQMDDYTLVFSRIWGNQLKEISGAKGVYCDNLRAVFTEYTGLHTSLGRRA